MWKGWQRWDTLFSSKWMSALLLGTVGATLVSLFLRNFFYEAFNCVEFEIASFAMLWGRGTPPYGDVSTQMAPIGFYGPLCYLVPALVGNILHTVDSPPHFLYTFRLIVFAYLLGSSFLLYRISRQLGQHKNLALTIVAVPLSYPWLTLGARPDWPGFFFSLLALSILIQSREGKRHVYLLAGLLLALAFLHYQRYLSLLLAASVYLIANKKIGQALTLLCTFCITTLSCLIPLSVFTHGGLITHSVVIPYLAAIPREGLGEMFQGVGIWFYLLVAMATYAYTAMASESSKNGRELLRIYTLTGILLTLFFLRSRGAAANHFLELVVAFCLMIVAFISDCRKQQRQFDPQGNMSTRVTYALFMLLLLLFPLRNFFNELRYWRADFLGVRGRYDATVGHEVEFEQLQSGPMLTDDTVIGFKTNHPETCTQTGYYTDLLWPRNMFDIRPTAERIRKKQYTSIVLMKHSRLYEIFKKEIEDHYRFTKKFGPYKVSRPKP